MFIRTYEPADEWRRLILRAEGDDDGNGDGSGGGGDNSAGGDQGDQGSGSNDNDGSDNSGSLLDLASNRRRDGDAGGDGSGDGGDGGQGDGGDGGEGSAGEVGLVLKERPPYLPEQFHNAETGAVNLEALTQSWKDTRDMARGRFADMADEKLTELGLQRVPEDAVTEARLVRARFTGCAVPSITASSLGRRGPSGGKLLLS